MQSEKFQAWLAGYALGGENEAARAVQAYTAFFGEPAKGAQVGPVFAEDGGASVPPEHGRIDVVTVSHCECTFAPNITLTQAVAYLRKVAFANRRAAVGVFEGERIGAMPSDSAKDVIKRCRDNSTKSAAPLPQSWSIAFDDDVTLETACERLCDLAADSKGVFEGKFAGKTLRVHPGDKPQDLQRRFWNEP